MTVAPLCRQATIKWSSLSACWRLHQNPRIDHILVPGLWVSHWSAKTSRSKEKQHQKLGMRYWGWTFGLRQLITPSYHLCRWYMNIFYIYLDPNLFIYLYIHYPVTRPTRQSVSLLIGSMHWLYFCVPRLQGNIEQQCSRYHLYLTAQRWSVVEQFTEMCSGGWNRGQLSRIRFKALSQPQSQLTQQ